MAKPIFKVFAARYTEAWYQLSTEEQNSLVAKVGESLEKVGGKMVILCDSSWSSEQWEFFGVQEFPDIEAVQQHAADFNELNWLRHLESVIVLGTEMRLPS